MRFGVIAENLVERAALAAGLVPTAMTEGYAPAFGRAIAVAKAARALRLGGVLVMGETLRPTSPGRGSQLGAFFDLYFALTSRSGTWSFEEMSSWQREAGLVPRKPAHLRFTKEIGLQIADRRASDDRVSARPSASPLS